MIRPPLPTEVFSRYDTDKTSGLSAGGHSYGPFYDSMLPRYRWSMHILEIGVFTGASLRALKEFFPDALITGLDIDRSRLIYEDRIRTHQVDCSDEGQLRKWAMGREGQFSVIIDDGSHRLCDQLLTFRMLKSCLKVGGLWVTEDIVEAEYAEEFHRLGFRVEEWDTHLRSDNRIGWYLNLTGD